MDGGKVVILYQLHQLFLDQLQHCHKGHYHAEAPFFGAEQLEERDKTAALEAFQHVAHALAGR